jgi:hypothetical protein
MVNVRSDMPKVLCEEPRRGMRVKTRKGSRRLDQSTPMDEKPTKELGNLRRQWKYNNNEGKEFGDHVQPLRRFMLSCVGRKWDDVYSEIRKTIPKGTVVNNHVYTHLYEYVATNVRMIDGKPYGAQEQVLSARLKNVSIVATRKSATTIILPLTIAVRTIARMVFGTFVSSVAFLKKEIATGMT